MNLRNDWKAINTVLLIYLSFMNFVFSKIITNWVILVLRKKDEHSRILPVVLVQCRCHLIIMQPCKHAVKHAEI
jgi:hypothetical protein